MEEKIAWMKNMGIIKLPEPVSYLYQFKGHDAVWLLTEREVAEKPLDELRTMFEQDREEARVSVENRRDQAMRYISICAPARIGKQPTTSATSIDLTEEEVQELENSTGDANTRSEFYLIPNDEDQTIIVGIMGADEALTLSKAKAELLAQLILGQVQKWKIFPTN